MTYSYTQISQYLTCPRRYRHRYLDGWKEKDTRAAMLFGRAFEKALGAFFPPRRSRSSPVRRMVCLPKPRLALLQPRLLGSHAAAGHHALDPVLPGRSRPGPPASTESADQVHATAIGKATTLSPTLTPSGNSTARAACWSGRPLRADIRKSLQGCCLSIRSWSATPG